MGIIKIGRVIAIKVYKESIYKRYVPSHIPQVLCADSVFLFAFSGSRLLIEIKGGEVFIPSLNNIGIYQGEQLFLGTFDGRGCYCMEVCEEIELSYSMEFRELRSLFGMLEEGLFLLAGKALQLVNWNITSQYCGRCGKKTEMKQEERVKICSGCAGLIYPRISPAVIVAIIKDDEILLAHARNFNENFYSVIAGFVEQGETLEDGVRREIMEEVGIRVKNIEYFGSQPWPFPDSLMLGFISEYESGEICVDGMEITDAGWYKWDNIPEIPTKMSIAGQMINWFINRFNKL